MDEANPFRLRPRHYALAVLAYLVLLLVWAPASLLAWALPRFTHEAASLTHTEGSLWNGQAAGLVVRLGSGSAVPLGPVSWRLRPQDLLAGKLGYQVAVAGADIRAAGQIRTGFGGTELRQARAELPASWLGQVSPDLELWQPGGTLVFETASLAFERAGGTSGEATVHWRDAASARVRRPLGSYRADLVGAERGFKLKLSTEAGPLQLQGSGLWNPGGGMTLFGLARPEPESRTELEGLLSLIGPAQADGSRAIRLSQRGAE